MSIDRCTTPAKPLTADEIADLKAKAMAATPGPWIDVGPAANAEEPTPLQWQHKHEIREIDRAPHDTHYWPHRVCQTIVGQEAAQADRDFLYIAAANPETVQRAIATIEQQAEQIVKLREACKAVEIAMKIPGPIIGDLPIDTQIQVREALAATEPKP